MSGGPPSPRAAALRARITAQPMASLNLPSAGSKFMTTRRICLLPRGDDGPGAGVGERPPELLPHRLHLALTPGESNAVPQKYMIRRRDSSQRFSVHEQ